MGRNGSSYVVVGVLARIDAADREGVTQRLDALDGVRAFPVPEPEKLGLVIEAFGIDAAHDRLRRDIDTMPGVLGTWPVSVEIEPGPVGCQIRNDHTLE